MLFFEGEEKEPHNRPLFCTKRRAFEAASSGLNDSPRPVAQSGLSQSFFPHPCVSCKKYFVMSCDSAALKGEKYSSRSLLHNTDTCRAICNCGSLLSISYTHIKHIPRRALWYASTGHCLRPCSPKQRL